MAGFDMKRDAFFQGLLAALRLRDQEFIDTRDDDHHRRFDRVVKLLRDETPQFDDVAYSLVPNPFTGRYREFDDALVRLQRGLLGAQNPFYPGVYLDISPSRAEKILATYSAEQKDVLIRLATAYLGESAEAGVKN